MNTETHKTIVLAGREIRYRLRPSLKAKLIRVSLSVEHGLVVTKPVSSTQENVDAFLRSIEKWILTKLEVVEQVKKKLPNRTFADGEELEYLGKKYPIVIEHRAGHRLSCHFDEVRFTITLDTTMERRKEFSKFIVERWLAMRAKHYITKRVHECAQRFGLRYARITIRNQKKRWGSCSESGNLNFNLRLMMAPPGMIDYVIMHELAHLTEQNHSPRFYALLEKMYPEYRAWEKWMKKHRATLHL